MRVLVWPLEPHRNERFQTVAGSAVRTTGVQGGVCLDNAAVEGVGIRVKNPGSKPMAGTPIKV